MNRDLVELRRKTRKTSKNKEANCARWKEMYNVQPGKSWGKLSNPDDGCGGGCGGNKHEHEGVNGSEPLNVNRMRIRWGLSDCDNILFYQEAANKKKR